MWKYLVAMLIVLFGTVAVAQESGTVVLLVDTSSSISSEQMRLQIDSYASVLQSVASVRNKRVVPIVFNTNPQILSNGSYMDAVGAFLRFPIVGPPERGQTCLSAALFLVEQLLPTLPRPVVLDISGDGEANCADSGTIPATLDRIANNHGVQVNTLFIDNHLPNPASGFKGFEYYKSLTRKHGFIIEAKSFMDFELSLFEKLTMEISWLDTTNERTR